MKADDFQSDFDLRSQREVPARLKPALQRYGTAFQYDVAAALGEQCGFDPGDFHGPTVRVLSAMLDGLTDLLGQPSLPFSDWASSIVADGLALLDPSEVLQVAADLGLERVELRVVRIRDVPCRVSEILAKSFTSELVKCVSTVGRRRDISASDPGQRRH